MVSNMLNSPFISWSSFLLNLAACVIVNMIAKLTSKDRINAIVVDDTLLCRDRSTQVELLARGHNHTGKGAKYVRGFRLLTLGWTDGRTFISLIFRHLSSENKRYMEMNSKIDKRTCGYKAREQAITPAPKVLVQLLKQTVSSGIPAKHVLMDCWFAFPSTIVDITKLGLNVVARIKKTPKVTYLFNGEKKTVNQIFSSLKKRRGRSKYLLSVDV
jgi:hypothetical protein